MARVIGIDGCPHGWVGISSDLHGYFGTTLERLLAVADLDGVIEVAAIDIPIGLPVNGPRQADVLARKQVGRRASSVFPTPMRSAITLPTYAEASEANFRASGKRLAKQTFMITPKIAEVDAFVRATPRTVIEIHPEVSFAEMAGHPLAFPKKVPLGADERRRLLAHEGIVLPEDLGDAARMGSKDDVLDAAAALWTAQRYLAGTAVSYPDPPERFGDGLDAAIRA